MKQNKNTKTIWSKDFTLVVIGQIISLFGNAILRFALPLYLLRETGSAALFGMVTACSFLPMIVLSFLGGVLADRVNKRDIMVGLDTVTAALIVIFYLCLGLVPLVPLLLVTLMLLYGISGTYQPAVQASIPALVAEDQVLTAGAVINQVSSLANLLGPILGGVLMGAFGIRLILILSALCFAASALMEVFIHIPFTPQPRGQGAWSIIRGDLQVSIHYIRGENPLLLQVILLAALFNLILSSLAGVGIPLILVETLGLSDKLLGFSQGASALGGLAGGFLTAILGPRLRLRFCHLLLLACGLLAATMALPLLLQAPAMAGFWVITLAGAALMVFATMFSVQVIAAVQVQTPPHLVGKVMALMMALSMCAQPLGQLIYGLLFDRFPQSGGILFLAAGGLAALIALASARLFALLDAPKA